MIKNWNCNHHQPLLFVILSCIVSLQCVLTFDVKGEIKFKDGEKPATLPDESFLVVKLQDVSLMDAPAKVLDIFEEKITDYPDKPLVYKLTSNITVESSQTIAVSAVINVGWNSNNSDDWLHPGDYLTDTQNTVDVSTNDNSYVKDVTVRQYTSR